MTKQEILITLEAHEWQIKEDLKTWVCVTCGFQYRGKNRAKLKHRKGCAYFAVIQLVQRAGLEIVL